jgi:hypothetical protein
MIPPNGYLVTYAFEMVRVRRVCLHAPVASW